MEKVSVIVPVYKVEEYIDVCINSIINQSYKNLEIILIDDGSPDKCGKICDNYCKIDNRIKVIHQENGGLSSARNAGILKATGDYLVFIDSDDYVNPLYIEKLYDTIKSTNTLIGACNYKNIYDNEPVEEDKIHSFSTNIYTTEEYISLLFTELATVITVANSVNNSEKFVLLNNIAHYTIIFLWM